jgi:hypothetical protein
MENGYEVFARENIVYGNGANAGSRQFIFVAECNYAQNYAFLAVSCVVRDKNSSRVIAVLNAVDENTNRLDCQKNIPESQLADLEGRDFIVSARYTVGGESEDGKNDENFSETVQTIEREFSFSVTVLDPIKNITPAAPLPKAGASVTRIVYGNRRDPDAAYWYPNVEWFSENNVKYVPVYIPFQGSVTVIDQLEILEVNPDILSLQLSSDTVKGVVAYKSDAPFSQLFSLSDDKKTLTWHFADFWNNNMELRNFNLIGGDFELQFLCSMEIKDTVSGQSFGADFMVTTYDASGGGSEAVIPKLYILWGCLAEGTGVTLSDGSVKPVESIVKGEKVKTKDGFAAVKEIITGSEAEMVAVQTQNAAVPLLLSKTHIIVTRRGEIPAIDLNAADDILTQSGEYSPVSYLELLSGGYKVYSLELEEPAYMYADGMLVGSYTSKIEKIQEQARKLGINPALRDRLIKENGGNYV